MGRENWMKVSDVKYDCQMEFPVFIFSLITY